MSDFIGGIGKDPGVVLFPFGMEEIIDKDSVVSLILSLQEKLSSSGIAISLVEDR